MKFLNTFRARLLIILIVLLIATLFFQYYLNLRTQEENNRLREKQEQALVAGFALGTVGITTTDYLSDLVKREDQTFFDEQINERIQDIIVINQKWQITDSLNNDELVPTVGANKEAVYKNLADVKNLPPLIESKRLGADFAKFPNATFDTDAETDGEAHVIPVDTSKGRWYVMVILKSDKKESAQRAARPLVYTLLVLSLSTFITILLVWRFTRPLADLSNAAREVAAGNLCVRVDDRGQRNEMGELAARFNEMTGELEKKQELEAKLQEAEKSAVVGRLGSAIAHEIRNPLNYINLTLDHLRAKFRPEDEKKSADFEKLTAQLKAEVARINQQISDFLSYSRPPTPNKQPTDVRAAIEDSLRIVEVQAADCAIKIGLIQHEEVPKILADPEYLRSLFNNLFINAVHAMQERGGRLTVKISADGDFAKIEIADTGNGIPEENLPKIFEPYFSTKETGTGLGLAIVQKIIDVHDGEIAVESNLNEGTEFVVRLPVAK
ncbi:MAG: HAMP domain-containing protein [Acidobacteria bacterium]|nr:HAMP domain-containing protein [Acidobacteriota bacterium]